MDVGGIVRFIHPVREPLVFTALFSLAKLSWTTASVVDADDVYIGELAGALQGMCSQVLVRCY